MSDAGMAAVFVVLKELQPNQTLVDGPSPDLAEWTAPDEDE